MPTTPDRLPVAIVAIGVALSLVMEPGGYLFGDYWRLGLPRLLLFGIVAVLLVPVFGAF